MPVPSDKEEFRRLLLSWTMGNVPAAEFLAEITALARLADDIVDKDDRRRQDRVVALLNRCLILLPNNAFYRDNAERLAPVLNAALIGWTLGDEWRKSPDEKQRIFGFVYRESTDRIATAVAFLIGGHEHALKVSRELYDTCHAPFTETIDDWSKD